VVFNAATVQAAAVNDGLQVVNVPRTPQGLFVQNRMPRVPNGPRHLVALVVDPFSKQIESSHFMLLTVSRRNEMEKELRGTENPTRRVTSDCQSNRQVDKYTMFSH